MFKKQQGKALEIIFIALIVVGALAAWLVPLVHQSRVIGPQSLKAVNSIVNPWVLRTRGKLLDYYQSHHQPAPSLKAAGIGSRIHIQTYPTKSNVVQKIDTSAKVKYLGDGIVSIVFPDSGLPKGYAGEKAYLAPTCLNCRIEEKDYSTFSTSSYLVHNLWDGYPLASDSDITTLVRTGVKMMFSLSLKSKKSIQRLVSVGKYSVDVAADSLGGAYGKNDAGLASWSCELLPPKALMMKKDLSNHDLQVYAEAHSSFRRLHMLCAR